MAEMFDQIYSFSEDGIIRLQKDLNYMFQHLDHKNVRRLYTEYCDISSEDGETIIDGPLLTMRAADSSTIRLKMGWDENSSDFVFDLYNAAGDPTIQLDSTGDAVFSGSLQTGIDAYIGEHLFVGSSVVPLSAVSTNTRGIFILKPGTTEYLGQIYSTNPAGVSTDWDFEIESSVGFNITGGRTMRIYMYAGYDGVSTATVNSSDYMRILSWNNRLFIQSEHAHSTDTGLFLGDDNNNVFMGSYRYGNIMRVRPTFDFENSWDKDIEYFYSRNQKFVTRVTTDWTEIGGRTTILGSTRVITSTRGVYIEYTTSNSSYAMAESTFTSLDLTKFVDGSAATTDDFLVAVVWLGSTYISSTGVHILLGNSSDDNYDWKFGSTYGYSPRAGWNVFRSKIGAYQYSQGAPALNNISFARCYIYFDAGLAGTGFNVDYIGIHRADPDDSNTWCDAQREINSTWTKQWAYTTYDIWMSHQSQGKACITPVNPYSIYNYEITKRGYKDFTADMKVYTHRGNEVPVLSWYGSTSLSCRTVVTSGVMRLTAIVNGSTYGDSITCKAFSAFTNCTLSLAKASSGTLHAYFKTDTDPDSIRTLRLDTPETSNVRGALYMGALNYNAGMMVSSLNVKPFTR